jgi:hypothetical protein
MAKENNIQQSTVLLGDLYSIRMKLVQSEIQRSRQRIRETGDQSENQIIGEIFKTDVVKKEFNVGAVIIKCNCNRGVQ